jgi:hypothetical protein
MNTFSKSLIQGAVAAALVGISSTASANLVLGSQVANTGQGFGAQPRLLTLQATGGGTTESVAVTPNGATPVLGAGIADATVFMGNTVTNAGGTGDVNPVDSSKYNVPTLAELGWTSGADVRLLFNASETGSDPGVNVLDVTLKFYSSTGAFITAIDGSFNLADSTLGNGMAGYLVFVDAAQQTFLNNTVFQGAFGADRIALEATIAGVADGPESFNAIGITTAIPEPETYAMMLSGLGLLAFIGRRRSRKNQ